MTGSHGGPRGLQNNAYEDPLTWPLEEPQPQGNTANWEVLLLMFRGRLRSDEGKGMFKPPNLYLPGPSLTNEYPSCTNVARENSPSPQLQLARDWRDTGVVGINLRDGSDTRNSMEWASRNALSNLDCLDLSTYGRRGFRF